MSPLTRARISTTRKLAGMELPAAFAESTSASVALIESRPRSKRRLADRRDLRRVRDQERGIERSSK